MVLPRLIDAAFTGGPLVVYDDGQQVRCFAHVVDVVAAVMTLMETPDALGRVFNVGSDQPVKILDLAKCVAATVDSALTIQFQSYAEAYSADFEDVRSRVPDLSRLRGTIDFRLRYDLDAIIRDVIAWRRNQAADYVVVAPSTLKIRGYEPEARARDFGFAIPDSLASASGWWRHL